MKSLVIETKQLEENIENIKAFCKDNTIIAVVKGDGYGLSLVPYASFLLGKGITHFAVSEANEALKLKETESFLNAAVLLMTPQNNKKTVEQLLQKGVTLTVGSMAHLDLIEQISKEKELVASVHIKVDTGFGRFGFSYRKIGRAHV